MLDLGATQSPVGSHALYARGVYTGYAAVVLPGVREATARKDWSVAAQQVGLVQATIERGTLTLAETLQILGGAEAASANPPVRAAGR